jgi:hypothetical protein
MITGSIELTNYKAVDGLFTEVKSAIPFKDSDVLLSGHFFCKKKFLMNACSDEKVI